MIGQLRIMFVKMSTACTSQHGSAKAACSGRVLSNGEIKMEKETAIMWLGRIRNRQTGGRDEFDKARREAIDLAITMIRHEALTPCDRCKYATLNVPEICCKCPAETVIE